MAEAKPFASLSSGLLARKGAARPAMKPQGFGQMGGANLEDLGWDDMGFDPPKPAEAPRDEDHDAFGEDVVDNARVHPTGLTPIQSPVHSQQAEIHNAFAPTDAGDEDDETAEQFDPETEAPFALATKPKSTATLPVAAEVVAPTPRSAPAPRSAPGAKSKAAFTLRLDPNRHLKLRLACAVNGRSAQQIVTDALDGLLSNMPELDAMAEKANRKG